MKVVAFVRLPSRLRPGLVAALAAACTIVLWAASGFVAAAPQRVPAPAPVLAPVVPIAPAVPDLAARWECEFEIIKGEMYGRGRNSPLAEQTYCRQSLALAEDRDPTDVILRRTEALAADIQKLPGAPSMTALKASLAQLKAQADKCKPTDLPARKALFMSIAALRRQIAFSNPLLNFKELLFVKSHLGASHCCDQYFGNTTRPGGSVYILSDPFGKKPVLRDILAGSPVMNGRLQGKTLAGGSFRAPELSYDGRQIFFAATQCGPGSRVWSPEKSYHVFKVNPNGTALTQITDGSWDDFDPCLLPSGRVAFISERRGGFGRCHPRPVPTYTLYSMNPDGSDIVPLSYHETNEWGPSVNNDGMIVYTRWDYIDRGDCIAHHPWITYPDGRDPRAMQGNYPINRRARPDQEMDIRAIPNSPLYVATAAPHHGQAFGSLVIFDPRVEDDGAMAAVKRLTPEARFPEVEGGQRIYGTAWPLNENYFLCAYAPPKATTNPSVKGKRAGSVHGIYLVDCFGNKELIHEDPSINCMSPIPVAPRPYPPLIPHATAVGLPAGSAKDAAAPTPTTGTVLCANVYNSRKDWPAGAKIKQIRVVQLYPKATIPVNVPDIGIGSESLARNVLGTATVEPDGSVQFVVPAGKPFYMQALDANGCAIQSMQSATYVHPGEKLTCQGCHEKAHGSPDAPTRSPMALAKSAAALSPEVEGSSPLSFPRLVQPVLDRNCVPCHTKNKGKAPDLSGVPATWNRPGYGGGNRTWSASYISLTTAHYSESDPIKGFAFSFSARPPDRTPTQTAPGQFGARASKLYQLLQKGHNGVKLSTEDMRRITTWLDCNSVFFSAYNELNEQIAGKLVRAPLE